MKIHVLASGSTGNSALLEAGGVSVLIDAGLSGSEIERRIAAVGADAGSLAGILITHEHADHVRGAGVLARRHRVPVYLTRGTHEAERRHLGELPSVMHIEPGREFELAGIGVRPFSTPHTRQGGGFADPVAYVFFHGGSKAGYATDLGHPTGLMAQHLAACRLLVLEFNHDPAMLLGGPYPWPVKQWIKGQGGHLSNEQAARLLERVLHDRLEGLVLAHLSETNNTPELARAAACEVLRHFRIEGRVGLGVAGPEKIVTAAVGQSVVEITPTVREKRTDRGEPPPHRTAQVNGETKRYFFTVTSPGGKIIQRFEFEAHSRKEAYDALVRKYPHYHISSSAYPRRPVDD